MGVNFFTKKMRAWINKVVFLSSDRKADVLDRHKTEFGVSKADYSFGWKDVIETTVSEMKVNGLLLTGSQGSGRHTAAEIAVNLLAGEEYGYEVLYLSGSDFVFSEEDINADEQERQNIIEKEDWDIFTDDIVHTFLDNLLNEFYNDERQDNLCIVMENISTSDMSELVYERMGNYIRMYENNDEFPSLFVIVIESDERVVSSSLRKRLRLMKMSLPNALQRKKMLINRGTDSVTAEAIANSTENFNYEQMRDLAENIAVWKELEDINSEFYQNFIATQLPEPDFAEENLFYVQKAELYEKLGRFLDFAPQLIERMGQVSYVGVPTMVQQTGAVSAEEQKQEKDKDKPFESAEDFERQKALLESRSEESKARIEKESETMQIGELMKDVLGEDRVNDIFRKRERN